MSKKVKVGLIGLGGICRWADMPAYLKMDEVEIAAICDILPEKIESFKEMFHMPEVPSFTDFNDLPCVFDGFAHIRSPLLCRLQLRSFP